MTEQLLQTPACKLTNIVYKNTFKWKSGIYKILSPTGSYYIGSTKNFRRRMFQHFRDLRLNCHTNIRLQNTYNKYPGFNWIFEAFESVNVVSLLDVEQKYLNEHFGNEKCININSFACKPPIGKGKKFLKGCTPWNKNIKTGPESIETRNAKSIAKKGKRCPKRTEEHQKKLNVWKKGYKQSKEHIENRIKHQVGKIYTKEHKLAISLALKNKPKTLKQIALKCLSCLVNGQYKKCNINRTVLHEIVQDPTTQDKHLELALAYLSY
jgi:group I intron endonuclease